MRKKHLLPENTDMVLSKLETMLLVPAVSLSVTLEYGTVKTYIDNLPTILYGLVAVLLAIGIAIPLSQLFGRQTSLYQRNIYRYALTFANYGFMGNAIVPLILNGDEALFRYCLFTLPIGILTYFFGIPLLIPKEHRSSNPILGFFNPAICAWLLGLLLAITGATQYIPGFALSVVSSLKNCMGPIAMFLTGFVIAGFSWNEILADKKVYIATFLRLFVLPAVILVLLHLLGASKEILALTFFAFATPLGMNTVVYPASYGMDTKTGAGMVTISHTLSVLSIPIMYTLFNIIF